MKLRHIELIHAILQTGSVSAAARLLNVTQPAATRALQHAESTLGYALFTRRAGRLHATEELQHLTPSLRQAFDAFEDTRRTALNLRRQARSTLRVGIVLSMSGALPRTYEMLAAQGEELRYEFSTGHYNTLLQWLLMHEIDVGIALEPPMHPAIAYTDLGERRLVCVGQPELLGKFARADSVPAEAMQSMPLIEIINTDPVGRLVASYAERYDWPFPARLAVKTHQIALELAQRGLGVAVVDDHSAAAYQPRLRALTIEPVSAIAVKAMTLQTRALPVAAERFVAAFRQVIQSPPPA